MPLKLPDFLSGFRRKPAADIAPPVEQAPSPIPSQQGPNQPDTPAPEPLDRLNRWLTLGANIGVLLGLVVLVVEVRQNAALTRTAMDQQKNDLLVQVELSLGKREMAEVWVKAIRTPEDLTDAEARMVESHLVSQMLQWDQLFQMESAGLVSHDRVRQHIINSAPFYFGSRFAKNWWVGEAPGWGGTSMVDVAGPIIDDLDENYLIKRLDSLKISPPKPEKTP